ncbi:post-transcriptional regulator [Cytobacillus purgationiresistens]|nr:post-transcriptional regulator [Cytobacillus purgationiresistens]
MHAYDIFQEDVEPAIQVKLDEFKLLGYEKVNGNEIWSFLVKKKWRNPKSDIRLFEIVDEVLAIKVGEFINFSTMEVYRDKEFSLDNEDEMRELLK